MRISILLILTILIGCNQYTGLQNVNKSMCDCYLSEEGGFQSKSFNCAQKIVRANKKEIISLSLNNSNISDEQLLGSFNFNLLDSLIYNCEAAFNDLDNHLNELYTIKNQDSISYKILDYTKQIRTSEKGSLDYHYKLLMRSKYYIASKLYKEALLDLNSIPRKSDIYFNAVLTKAHVQSLQFLFKEAIETYNELRPSNIYDAHKVRSRKALMNVKLNRNR